MTLLIAFIGVDQKKDGPKPASVYVASDSRISWGNIAQFDFGKKVFGCQNYPDIFGYCGDVLFPSIVLNQIVDTIDRGLLFDSLMPSERKFQLVINKMIQIFNHYPKEVKGITQDTFQIIHASRSTDRTFFARKMKWTKLTGRWAAEEVVFSNFSDKLYVAGSGSHEFKEKLKIYQGESRTSRAIFQCFCDTLANMNDKYCGGPPQMYGLYRIKKAIPFGIIKDKKRYYGGMEVTNLHNFNAIEWRNELFERCDGFNLKLLDGAKSQPNILE